MRTHLQPPDSPPVSDDHITARTVSKLDMKDSINRRDREPAPGALDCRPLAGPDARRDLTSDERVVLIALAQRDPSTGANLGGDAGDRHRAGARRGREVLT